MDGAIAMPGELIPLERRPGQDPAAPESTPQQKSPQTRRKGSQSTKKSQTARKEKTSAVPGKNPSDQFVLDETNLALPESQDLQKAVFHFDLSQAEKACAPGIKLPPGEEGERPKQLDTVAAAGMECASDGKAPAFGRRLVRALTLLAIGAVAALLLQTLAGKEGIWPDHPGQRMLRWIRQEPDVPAPVREAAPEEPSPLPAVKKIAVPSLAGLRIKPSSRATAPARPAGRRPAVAPTASATGERRAAKAVSPAIPAGKVTSIEVDTQFLLAEEYLLTGDRKEAESIYRRLVAAGPQRGRAAQALGELYFQAGDYRRAEEMYREAARLFRDGAP